jgi:RNA 2',3'-cyclic 3'-phosphodiesterase
LMRAFLAFDISHEVIEKLLETQLELRETRADVGLVGKENLHFTVKFLGEIPDDVVQEVDARVAGLDLPAFEIGMAGVGVFPDLQRPRIVWAGVAEVDEQVIVRTAEAIIEALEGIGKPEEREFRAHVTIGRVRSSRNIEGLVAFARKSAEREFGRTRIVSLKLKSSLLTPNGPIYKDIREYVLK